MTVRIKNKTGNARDTQIFCGDVDITAQLGITSVIISMDLETGNVIAKLEIFADVVDVAAIPFIANIIYSQEDTPLITELDNYGFDIDENGTFE